MFTQDKKPGSRGSDSEEGSLIVDDVRQEVLKQSQMFSFRDGFPRKNCYSFGFCPNLSKLCTQTELHPKSFSVQTRTKCLKFWRQKIILSLACLLTISQPLSNSNSADIIGSQYIPADNQGSHWNTKWPRLARSSDTGWQETNSALFCNWFSSDERIRGG